MSKNATSQTVYSPTSVDAPIGSSDLSELLVYAMEETLGSDAPRTLYEVIDPDALDALFAPRYNGEPREPGTVILDYGGRTFIVESTGSVLVE
ncbi:HalOD1 output domain-containing protein [Halomarina pelagica]|uniref:HalOD1 output domain-containing protein n=1 Tax=Halomarina pelagica TaxID=2961599 RepID=UPI0020C30D58|nr:HalOD1 output domain-containing protein [Halomarina sp. BND7]